MDVFSNLPNELITKIGYKALRFRNIDLNLDIQNFYQTKEMFLDEYSNIYIDPNIDLFEFILGDIFSYLNENELTCDVFKRHNFFKNATDLNVRNYIYFVFEEFNTHKRFNIIWGLMTPIERYNCLEYSLSNFFT